MVRSHEHSPKRRPLAHRLACNNWLGEKPRSKLSRLRWWLGMVRKPDVRDSDKMYHREIRPLAHRIQKSLMDLCRLNMSLMQSPTRLRHPRPNRHQEVHSLRPKQRF